MGLMSQAPPEVECLQSMPGVPGLSMVPGWHQLSQHLLQQLEHTNAMYQSILQEQQAFGTSAAAMSPGPQFRAPNTDVLHHYAIQQQLLLSIIHCYQLLSIQQMEISQLQQATHQTDDGFFGCCRYVESILAVIVSADEAAQQVCRIQRLRGRRNIGFANSGCRRHIRHCRHSPPLSPRQHRH
ncbi:hypothetical protein HPB52_011293 [Rhipicephalus sanguineus]|uniref:Uncharacterized protein n=1 Tax=Rhipicephalus sanguineus TaxID=34632 RepID=A0A9D4T1V4_RHISA|nr:hypothetical protein HPB52_011293 [Rhipicephalus sanguineus]